MNTFFKAAAITLLSGLWLTSAQAGHDDDQMYFDVMGSAASSDADRQLDRGWGGIALRIGKPVNDRWNVEGALDVLDLQGDPMFGGNDFDQTVIGANAIRVFYRDSWFQPTWLVGAGVADSQYAIGQGDKHAYWQTGLGFLSPIMDGKGRFRTEILYRSENDSISAKDYVLNIGFGLPFGKKAAPVVPMQDSDGDGVADDKDRCPGTPAGAKVNANGCEPDSDRDGVVDRLDKCPGTPAGAKVDAKGCELDSDGDGVVDSKDQCPGTPRGKEVDAKGCPVVQIVDLDGVNFRINSADLASGAAAVLDTQAAKLKANEAITIEVAGHTDSAGEAGYNMSLSTRRALTVRDYLVAKGVSASRISAKGYGETAPIASNSTTQGRADNRRVELRIRKK